MSESEKQAFEIRYLSDEEGQSAELCLAEELETLSLSSEELVRIIQTIRAKKVELLKILETTITLQHEGAYHTLHVYHPETGTMSSLETSIGGDGLPDQVFIFKNGEILHDRGKDALETLAPQKIYPVGPGQKTVIRREDLE